jgi:hypothetical protein
MKPEQEDKLSTGETLELAGMTFSLSGMQVHDWPIFVPSQANTWGRRFDGQRMNGEMTLCLALFMGWGWSS